MSNKSGFVLAEVLVVAVIVAILAGAAIPIYTSYITSQRQSVAKNLAQTAAVSGNVYWRRTGAAPAASDLKLFFADSTRFTVTVQDPWVKITDVSVTPSIKDSAKFR